MSYYFQSLKDTASKASQLIQEKLIIQQRMNEDLANDNGEFAFETSTPEQEEVLDVIVDEDEWGSSSIPPVKA